MSWIQTIGGRKVDFLNPDVSAIDIQDIAHALGSIPHYNGHTSRWFSVAEHSVWVSHIVSPEAALYGLLHDASEAYTGDMPGPLKRLLDRVCAVGMEGCEETNPYREVERRLTNAVLEAFNVPYNEDIRKEVKEADTRMLVTEHLQLQDNTIEEWAARAEPYRHVTFACWNPQTAKLMFLLRFKELTGIDAITP